MAAYDAFAGLVRVTDRYGDYGDVGFFLSHGGGKTHSLQHFRFSCRILNMGVESRVYRWLGRPYLRTARRVLSDPVNDDREIDWITCDNGVPRSGAHSADTPLGRLLLRGSCDMTALSHYVADLADEVHVEHHVDRDDRTIINYHSAFLRLALEDVSSSMQASLLGLGYVPQDWTSTLTLPRPSGRRAVWLFSFWMDAFAVLYRHRKLELVVPFTLAKIPHAAVDVTALDDAYISGFMATEAQRSALEELRRNYTAIGRSDEKFVRSTLRALADRADDHTLICILLGPEAWVDAANGKTRREAQQARVNAWIRRELGKKRNVALLDPADIVGSNEPRAEALHFHRLFYQQIGQEIRGIVLNWADEELSVGKSPMRTVHARQGKHWRRHVATILSRLGHG